MRGVWGPIWGPNAQTAARQGKELKHVAMTVPRQGLDARGEVLGWEEWLEHGRSPRADQPERSGGHRAGPQGHAQVNPDTSPSDKARNPNRLR